VGNYARSSLVLADSLDSLVDTAAEAGSCSPQDRRRDSGSLEFGAARGSHHENHSHIDSRCSQDIPEVRLLAGKDRKVSNGDIFRVFQADSCAGMVLRDRLDLQQELIRDSLACWCEELAASGNCSANRLAVGWSCCSSSIHLVD
jgi:hypothetical protein